MTDDVYSKARDAVADILDAMGYTDQPYNAADHLIGKLDTAGYMVWPKREDWKRLDELEAERDQLRGLLRKLALATGARAAGDIEGPYLNGHAWGLEVSGAESALFKKVAWS